MILDGKRSSITLIGSVKVAAGLSLALLQGCANRSGDCNATATCPETGTAGLGGSGPATGASSGDGGMSVTNAASAGVSGQNVAGNSMAYGGADASAGRGAAGSPSLQVPSAGAAGGPAQRPCGGLCTGTAPICDEASNTCVECLDGSHCSGAKPFCYTRLNICAPAIAEICAWTPPTPVYSREKQTCVECLASTDCHAASVPFCNTATNTCVDCFSNDDCRTATKSRCNTASNSCAPCIQDTDCIQVDGKHICNAGVCVQCSGTKYSDCGKLNGKDLVCDSLNHACSSDKTAGSGDACTPCVSDAQCKAGQLCAEQRFNSQLVGRFCFWKEEDTANGAPSSCANGTARPYVFSASSALSIDGSSATLCGLRKSTCVALNQYGKTPCSQSGGPAPKLCGFYPGADSSCIQDASTSAYLCTVTCTSDDDCPSSGASSSARCDLYSTPHVCTLP